MINAPVGNALFNNNVAFGDNICGIVFWLSIKKNAAFKLNPKKLNPQTRTHTFTVGPDWKNLASYVLFK